MNVSAALAVLSQRAAMSAPTIVCLLALGACIGSFVWAMGGGYFRRVDQPGLGFRAIQVCGALALAWTAWAFIHGGAAGPISVLAALLVYAASLALFWWAIRSHTQPPTHAFSADVPTALVVRGPYRLIRHPFYTSYLLTWAAGVIATHEATLLMPLAIMTVVYARAAAIEEQKFLCCALAGEYSDYRLRTGQFLPWM